jgi:hypothetical protein
MSEQKRFLLSLLGLVVVVLLGRQLYQYVAYRDERALLVGLREEVVDAGAEVTRTRQESDSLRALVEAANGELEQNVRVLRRYNRIARGGMLPPDVYARYAQDRARYEETLRRQEEWAGTWKGVVARNHGAVDRYNRLADSIRAVAARIGDPYYSVPLPAEAAAERGVPVRRR